jgi:hypothetical protein
VIQRDRYLNFRDLSTDTHVSVEVRTCCKDRLTLTKIEVYNQRAPSSVGMHIFLFLAAIAVTSPIVYALPPVIGPYNVSSASYKVSVIDSSDPSIWLFFPLCNSSECKFPLISYLHGMAGGDVELLGYALFFEQIASYGLIIAAPDSCFIGCTNPNKGKPYTDCAGLPPMTPDPTWNPWYGEAFKVIEVSCYNLT